MNEQKTQEPSEAEQVCHETYAVLGALLLELAEQGHTQAEKLLDNLVEARLVHRDVVPWDFAASPSLNEIEQGAASQGGSQGGAHGVAVGAPQSEAQVRAAFEKRMLDFGWRNFDGGVLGDPKCWYYDNSDLNARWVGWREAVRAHGVALPLEGKREA